LKVIVENKAQKRIANVPKLTMVVYYNYNYHNISSKVAVETE